MITRIVRMSFKPDSIDDFVIIFNRSKAKIRNMPGCEYLSLHRDYHHEHVFYTVSKWTSQYHLDKYRDSKLFKLTWASTKLLFSDRPSAHSLVEQEELG